MVFSPDSVDRHGKTGKTSEKTSLRFIAHRVSFDKTSGRGMAQNKLRRGAFNFAPLRDITVIQESLYLSR